MRLVYLDCLRGIVMLMVVFSHVSGSFCLGLSDDFWISSLFSVLMLPGFFFVSGWFTHINISGGGILKRLRLMLLPTLLMFLIYVYCYWGTYDRLVYCAFGEYKFGYWFTFALFLMNLVHWGVSALAGKLPVCESNRSKLLLLLIAVMAVVLVGLKDWDWNSNRATLANWFSLRLIAMYFPFYFMGIVCRRYEQLFHKMIANGYITGMVTIAFALTMLHTGGGFYFALLQETLGVTLLYSLCYVCRNILSDNTFVGRQLALIGRNTLPIYLIHYFMFLGLKFPVAGAVFDVHSQWLVVFFVAALLTLFVVYASIGMTKILVLSSPLRRVLIGK